MPSDKGRFPSGASTWDVQAAPKPGTLALDGWTRYTQSFD